MALKSDIVVNASKFDPKNVSEKTIKLSEELLVADKSNPSWWEVGAPKYREMRIKGETSLPVPIVLPHGQDIHLPSRDSDRTIPCRLFMPSSKSPKGVILHIHGGGWVLMSEKTSDTLLHFYAETANCVVISAGYRLAPEYPFPAGPEDCFDVAEYLVKNAEKEYGGPLRFMGGESAGGHLSMVTTFHLLRTFPALSCPVLLLHFGAYDLSMLPQSLNLKNPPVLNLAKMTHFINAFLPNYTLEQKRHPSISPFYEEMYEFRGRLPKALLTCGTNDALLDDSVLMSVKWQMAGGEAVLKLYEGAVHGFVGFPAEKSDEAATCKQDTKAFIESCLA